MKSDNIFSVYEAKARFSELLRRVRKNQKLIITHHGKPVARLLPYADGREESLDERLRALEEDGLVSTEAGSMDDFKPLCKREGTLARFLSERE